MNAHAFPSGGTGGADSSRPLRLAIFNPLIPEKLVAEHELAQRMAMAIAAKGWEAVVLHRPDQVDRWSPDAVLCLHPQETAKLTAHPWLACYWNPPGILRNAKATLRERGEWCELSYDGYLVSGEQLKAHITGRLAAAGASAPMMPFHTSSPGSARLPTLRPDSRLFYVGSNWDGKRFPLLLNRLAVAGVLALHGTRDRWEHLLAAYCGPVPFDGHSVIEAAHRYGLGLCLHLPQHREAGVPNMRIFELCAAGALTIADRHPFIEQWFGDSVLYVDAASGEEALAEQVLSQVAWARANPVTGRAMAAAAQDIFNRHLCLETLLDPLPVLLQQVALGDSSLRRMGEPAEQGSLIQVILPCGPGGAADLVARLDTLTKQEALPAGVTIRVIADPAAGRGVWPDREILWVTGPGPFLHRALASTAPGWVSVLPDGARLEPWHYARLLDVARKHPASAAIQAAVLCPAPPSPQAADRNPNITLELLLPGSSPETSLASMAGMMVRRDLLDDRIMAALSTAALENWATGVAYLGYAIAARAKPGRCVLPTVQLHRLPSFGGEFAVALKTGLAADPAIETFRSRTNGAPLAPPSCLTGMNDLDPVLVAGIPYLSTREDLAQIPGRGRIWLYGSSRGGELVLSGLSPAGRKRVVGFLDSIQRGQAFGFPVLLPTDVPDEEMREATVIISAQYVSEIFRKLRLCSAAPAFVLNAYPFIFNAMD